MKVRFYLDIHPFTDPSRYGMCAMTQPGAKVDSAKRIAFDVTIPDSLLFHIDGHAAEVSAVEVVSKPEKPHDHR